MTYTKPNELRARLLGVNVIMVTPFHENGEVDLTNVRELTNYLVDNGIREGSGVLIANGSMGECFSMNPEERKTVSRAIVEEADRRVPVVVACNDTNIRTVIDLCQSAQDAGADGVMVMPPYYLPPLEDEILQFYSILSQNIDVGIIVYNAPIVTVDISLHVLQELADMEKMVGLKDVTHDYTKFKSTVQQLKGKLTPLNGVGELWEPLGTFSGTEGFFSLAANFVPDLSLSLWNACKNGDYEQAIRYGSKFISYFMFQSDFGKFIQATKKIMRDLSLPGGYVRTPLVPLTEHEEQQLEKIADEMDLK